MWLLLKNNSKIKLVLMELCHGLITQKDIMNISCLNESFSNEVQKVIININCLEKSFSNELLWLHYRCAEMPGSFFPQRAEHSQWRLIWFFLLRAASAIYPNVTWNSTLCMCVMIKKIWEALGVENNQCSPLNLEWDLSP